MTQARGRTVGGTIAAGLELLFRNPMIFLILSLPQAVSRTGQYPFADYYDALDQINRFVLPRPTPPQYPTNWDGADFSQHPSWVPIAPVATGPSLDTIAGSAIIGTVSVIFFVLLVTALYVFHYATVCVATRESELGARPDLWQVYRASFENLPALIWANILVTLVVLPGVVLAVGFYAIGARLGVPMLTGIFAGVVGTIWVLHVSIRFVFVTPVVLFEQYRGSAALRRSSELSDGSWMRIFGIFAGDVLLFGLTIAILYEATRTVGPMFGYYQLMPWDQYSWIPASGAIIGMGLLTALVALWARQIVPITMMLFYSDITGGSVQIETRGSAP